MTVMHGLAGDHTSAVSDHTLCSDTQPYQSIVSIPDEDLGMPVSERIHIKVKSVV